MNAHLCPVCGQTEFSEIGSYEICDVCGWEDDDYQMRFPDSDGGANHISLNQARQAYLMKTEKKVAMA